jgi:hypothetical protein
MTLDEFAATHAPGVDKLRASRAIDALRVAWQPGIRDMAYRRSAGFRDADLMDALDRSPATEAQRVLLHICMNAAGFVRDEDGYWVENPEVPF